MRELNEVDSKLARRILTSDFELSKEQVAKLVGKIDNEDDAEKVFICKRDLTVRQAKRLVPKLSVLSVRALACSRPLSDDTVDALITVAVRKPSDALKLLRGERKFTEQQLDTLIAIVTMYGTKRQKQLATNYLTATGV